MKNKWRRGEKDLIHQLSTPLTNSLWWLEKSLEEKSTTASFEQKNLELARQELKKVFQLINKREAKNLQKTNFSPTKVVQDLLQTYQKPCRISYQFQTINEQLKLYGKENVFREIVTHLLNNASEAYYDHCSQRFISITLVDARHGLNLLIGDHGRGMFVWQKLMVARRGISFKKVKSGLGLWQVKKLLQEEFDGKLEILTQKQRGTLIIVYFPF